MEEKIKLDEEAIEECLKTDNDAPAVLYLIGSETMCKTR
jgi:hypothetical protein